MSEDQSSDTCSDGDRNPDDDRGEAQESVKVHILIRVPTAFAENTVNEHDEYEDSPYGDAVVNDRYIHNSSFRREMVLVTH